MTTPSLQTVPPRRRVVLCAAAVMLAAAGCGGRPVQSTVAPDATVSAEEGTLAVTVTQIQPDCKPENRCAEVEGIRTLLFVGVPGSPVPRAMIQNEDAALRNHAAFFRRLLEDGGHTRYVTGVRGADAGGGAPRGAKAWTVVVNYHALRIALENEGVIRKFGYR